MKKVWKQIGDFSAQTRDEELGMWEQGKGWIEKKRGEQPVAKNRGVQARTELTGRRGKTERQRSGYIYPQ